MYYFYSISVIFSIDIELNHYGRHCWVHGYITFNIFHLAIVHLISLKFSERFAEPAASNTSVLQR